MYLTRVFYSMGRILNPILHRFALFKLSPPYCLGFISSTKRLIYPVMTNCIDSNLSSFQRSLRGPWRFKSGCAVYRTKINTSNQVMNFDKQIFKRNSLQVSLDQVIKKYFKLSLELWIIIKVIYIKLFCLANQSNASTLASSRSNRTHLLLYEVGILKR